MTTDEAGKKPRGKIGGLCEKGWIWHGCELGSGHKGECRRLTPEESAEPLVSLYRDWAIAQEEELLRIVTEEGPKQ